MEILPNSTTTFTGRNGEETYIDYALIPRGDHVALKGHATWKDCPIKSDHRPITTELVITNDMSTTDRPARIRTALLKQKPYREGLR